MIEVSPASPPMEAQLSRTIRGRAARFCADAVREARIARPCAIKNARRETSVNRLPRASSVLCRLSGVRTLQDPIDVASGLAEAVLHADTVRHEASSLTLKFHSYMEGTAFKTIAMPCDRRNAKSRAVRRPGCGTGDPRDAPVVLTGSERAAQLGMYIDRRVRVALPNSEARSPIVALLHRDYA
jgi:hypothetical protein